MASMAEARDDFDEIESLSQSGTFWSPRDPEKHHPEKLVLRCTGWQTVASKYDTGKERPVLVGETRDGSVWKVPCDNLDLLPLHTGDVKEWNDDRGRFEIVDNWGPVRDGEVVAIEYRGDREYTNRAGLLVTTGTYRFTRKPAVGRRARQRRAACGNGGGQR
jgi:hypothetical protein